MLKGEALVYGVPLPDMDKTISIRVLRAFHYKGALQSVGTKLDYPYHLALEAIGLGKAERYEVPAKEPEPPKAEFKVPEKTEPKRKAKE